MRLQTLTGVLSEHRTENAEFLNAKAVLGEMPEKIKIQASGNIIKNVKSVIVPKTGGMHGIEAAVAAGIL